MLVEPCTKERRSHDHPPNTTTRTLCSPEVRAAHELPQERRSGEHTGAYCRRGRPCLRAYQEVELAPSTWHGRPTGPAIGARARVRSLAEAVHAGQALAQKYPLLQGFLVPLYHRLRGYRTMHVELTPVDR
jgi:hypothetical protein